MKNKQPTKLSKDYYKPQNIFTGSENDLELNIIDDLQEISDNCKWGEIIRYQQQFTLKYKKGRIVTDIFIWHKDGTGTLIEVKKNKTNRNDLLTAISQILFYGNIIERKLKFKPRFVIAINELNEDIYDLINEYNLPINLLMYDKNRCVYLPHKVVKTCQL
jgi:hypothetical protein